MATKNTNMDMAIASGDEGARALAQLVKPIDQVNPREWSPETKDYMIKSIQNRTKAIKSHIDDQLKNLISDIDDDKLIELAFTMSTNAEIAAELNIPVRRVVGRKAAITTALRRNGITFSFPEMEPSNRTKSPVNVSKIMESVGRHAKKASGT